MVTLSLGLAAVAILVLSSSRSDNDPRQPNQFRSDDDYLSYYGQSRHHQPVYPHPYPQYPQYPYGQQPYWPPGMPNWRYESDYTPHPSGTNWFLVLVIGILAGCLLAAKFGL